MLRHPLGFRFTTALVASALLAGPVLPTAGLAQPADPAVPVPQLTPDPVAVPEQADPPARVGRLARLRGTVSYHPGSAESWDRAQANWPLTTGDAIWTEPDGRTELELAGGVIQLQGGSEFSIDRLDDHSLGATLHQGEIRLRLPSLTQGESLRVQTPRGMVTITTPGRYDIVAGNTENPTRVMVYQGSAELGGSLRLGARQVALISGADPFTTATEAAGADPFRSMAPLPAARYARSAPVPHTVAQLPGGAELSAYGAWEPTPEYGAVWYPEVAAGWTPYRNGHWAFVAPWGWTWIDDAPWGFAPFHYGRWLQLGGRWAWTPGGYAEPGYIAPAYAEPVYAPALVTFFGLGLAAGAVVGAGLYGGYGGNIGWCPLGPREAYHPWYGASRNYIRNVNMANVSNVTNVTTNNTTSIQNFRNRAAATQIPAAAMVASQPVRPIAQAVPGVTLASARPLTGLSSIAPTAATAGMTPNLVRRFAGPASGGAIGANAIGASAIGASAIGSGAIGAAAVAGAARRPAPGPAIRAISPVVPASPTVPMAPPAPALRVTAPEAVRPSLPGSSAVRPAGPIVGAPLGAIQGARPAFGVAPALPQPGLQRPPGVAGPAGAAAARIGPTAAPRVATALPARPSVAAPIVHPPAVATVAPVHVAPAAPVFRPLPPQPTAGGPGFRPPPLQQRVQQPVQPPIVHAPPPAAPVFHAPPQQAPQPVFRPPPPQPAAARPPPPAREQQRDRLHP